MRVAFIAAECEPWAKTGGLGDVVDALARALGRLPGALDRPADVYLPRYRGVPVPPDASSGPTLDVPDPLSSSGTTSVSLVDVAASGYRLRLVDLPAAFDRDGFYGDRSGDYPDNAWRFGMFCRTAIEAIRSDGPADILHIHDWHACPVPLFRDLAGAADPWLGSAAVVLTIHNLAYHGWTARAHLAELGLEPGDGIVPAGADGLDLLRAGIVRSDVANTVSPTYAEEARTSGYGFGLEDVLRAKGDRFVGILNGLDPVLWDPATDRVLAARYDRADRTGKAICRRDLLERVEMDPDDDGAVLGAVGRLDPQKGFDLVAGAGEALLRAGARLVIQASGHPEIADGLRDLERRYPRRVRFIEKFDRDMARRIYAGVDLFLIPSRFEPSGQVQMISLRYGTPPVARATGGLVDSIVDVTEHPDTGTGFLFGPATAGALADACVRAMRLRSNEPAWAALLDRGMAVDFSWGSSAAPAYLDLYRRAIEVRRSPAT
ncbi:MAG TPA: glycogen/starch synthase [Candidatus Dormibacteraeota bacterium]|nr:glycogen/starch synthase [Candidatus Dormibacteraeota bacterium]